MGPEKNIDISKLPRVVDAIRSEYSRYQRIPIVSDDSNRSTLGLYFKSRGVYDSVSSEKIYEVTSGTEFRPDLISQIAYQNHNYWWIIMEYNDLGGIEDIKAGMTLRIPSLSQVLLARTVESDENLFI